MKLGEKINYALRPDAQAFDEIRIVTVPRYKESGLSGDEWRISAEIQFWRKGKHITSDHYRDIETACGFLYASLHQAISNGKAFFAGEDGTCDQEGCAEPATVTYRLKKQYCRDGHGTEPHRPTYRKFCARHKTRGNSALDDCDSNYEFEGDPQWCSERFDALHDAVAAYKQGATPPPQGSTQETPSEEELLKLTADSIRRQCERKGADIYIEYAKLSKQWQKWFDIAHPKAPPSCLACGQVKPFDIQRMDMPGIGICCHCVAALRSQSSLKPQDGERLADDNRRYLVAFGHRHVSKQDGTDTCAECDLDLRDPIHFRYGESRKTRQEGTTP